MEPVRVESRVEASMPARSSTVTIKARDAVLEVSEPPELGGEPGRVSPTELVLAGLAACEAIMFRMVAKALRLDSRFDIGVRASGVWEAGKGLVELRVTVTVKGLDEKAAHKVWETVKKTCPVYATLARAAERVVDEVHAQP